MFRESNSEIQMRRGTPEEPQACPQGYNAGRRAIQSELDKLNEISGLALNMGEKTNANAPKKLRATNI